MESVKMVTNVAGEEMYVGECHPARARVLVKKELASWRDGKVLLHVLNVHDKLLSSNPEAARGPLDDNNVSKQEMERRFAWFRSFMDKTTRVLVAGRMELPSKEEAEELSSKEVPPSSRLPIENRYEKASREEQASFEEACLLVGKEFTEDNFIEELSGDPVLLSSLWDEVPDPEPLHTMVQSDGSIVSLPSRNVPDALDLEMSTEAPVVQSREAYSELLKRDRELVSRYLADNSEEGQIQEVATLKQIRFARKS